MITSVFHRRSESRGSARRRGFGFNISRIPLDMTGSVLWSGNRPWALRSLRTGLFAFAGAEEFLATLSESSTRFEDVLRRKRIRFPLLRFRGQMGTT
jgi:hypothetical protein